MNPALIGAGLSAVTSVIGAIGSARAQRKADQMVSHQKAKNQAWYDREYNANYLQRSDAQAVLENTRKFYDDRLQRASGANTVMGGTDEAMAMNKAGANEAVASQMAQMNADASAHKDNIQQNYMNADAALSQQQIAGQQQRAQDIAQAAGEAGKMSAGIVGNVLTKK